jgi:hypothetical protein
MALKKELGEYDIKRNENLIYKIIINENMEFCPGNPKKPRRGNLSFQTDLIIKNKKGTPLVVIETKFGGFSTHDVLTYSTKALKHKEIYPYLRYGFVVGGVNVIQNRFFTHNLGLDFAIAIKDTHNLKSFLQLVKEQIKSSETLLQVLKDKNKTKLFSLNVVVENGKTNR